MPAPLLQGIVTALVTPFREDERIDFNAWQTTIDKQIEAGVDGILAAAAQGEFFSLNEEERLVAVRFARQAAGRRVPVYANVGCPSTRETIRLAQKAADEGVACLVVMTPYYVRPSEDELADHYIEVCRAVRLPVLAYNLPASTGVDLTPAAMDRIAATCENFAGVKDSTGDLDRLAQISQIARRHPLAVFTGLDHQILPALQRGYAGAMSGGANVAPRLFVELLRAFRSGDLQTAARLQALAEQLTQAFRLHTFPAVIKEAMHMIGPPAGPCRRPVSPVPDDLKRALADILNRLREEHYLPETA